MTKQDRSEIFSILCVVVPFLSFVVMVGCNNLSHSDDYKYMRNTEVNQAFKVDEVRLKQ